MQNWGRGYQSMVKTQNDWQISAVAWTETLVPTEP